jgi:hypothetical protein
MVEALMVATLLSSDFSREPRRWDGHEGSPAR